MRTVTMRGVAKLAGVARPVVSMWRSRFANSDRPFPEPVVADTLTFDADAVAEWLVGTGHGNNDEAHLEAALHSSAFQTVASRAEDASILLLLQELVGEPLTEFDAMDAVVHVAGTPLEPLVPPQRVIDLLADKPFVATVDELVEAAFSGRLVLDQLVASFTQDNGAWKSEALTDVGLALVGRIIHELCDTERVVVPAGAGGLVLALALHADSEPDERLALSALPELVATPEQRIAWRTLAAHGAEIHLGADFNADLEAAGDAPHREHTRLVVAQQQAVADPVSFFNEIDDIVLELGAHDVALVIGPAALLTDDLSAKPELARLRASILAGERQYVAPLRYVASLPKGLARFGGRRRLAVWVLAHGDSHLGKSWTVYGEHRDTTLDESAITAIAADVATAVAGGKTLAQHAFHSSAMRETGAFLRQEHLHAPVRKRSYVDGRERLARVWELDRGVLPQSVRWHANEVDAPPIELPWSAVVPRLAKDVAGHRVPKSLFEYPVAPAVTVVSADEVREPHTIGQRTVNRLQLAAAVPHAEFSQPGDIAYTTAGKPAVWIDEVGGHLVLYPARILRLRPAEPDATVLHPLVVAQDIAAQSGRDRSSWRFRTVPRQDAQGLSSASTAIGARRAELEQRLRELHELEHELVEGLTAGVLSASDDPTNHESPN